MEENEGGEEYAGDEYYMNCDVGFLSVKLRVESKRILEGERETHPFRRRFGLRSHCESVFVFAQGGRKMRSGRKQEATQNAIPLLPPAGLAPGSLHDGTSFSYVLSLN